MSGKIADLLGSAVPFFSPLLKCFTEGMGGRAAYKLFLLFTIIIVFTYHTRAAEYS